MTVFLIVAILCCIVIASIILLFTGDNDWPDDDHLEPPQGGRV